MKPILFACILLAVFSSTLAAQNLQCYEGTSELDNRHKRDCPKTTTFCYTRNHCCEEKKVKQWLRYEKRRYLNASKDREGCRQVADGELCCCKKKLCNLSANFFVYLSIASAIVSLSRLV